MLIKIFQLLYSILNLFLLNIYLGFIKLQNKKIILFYHPKEDLTSIHDFYLSKFLYKDCPYKVIFGSKNIIKNHFYLKGILLKFILFIDIFVSNNISDSFTKKSKRIYIHHDIYDTPLVDKKDELNLKKRLLRYDIILIPSKKSSYIFEKIFEREIKSPEIKILGFYPKLNYLLKKQEIKKNNPKKIIIAPTHYGTFKELNLNRYLKIMILKLIKSNFEVIYRPHPSNIYDKKVKNIQKSFEKYSNFFLDTSSNYLDSYSSSKFMITDVSGTAYTYAMLTKKPVFFFSKSEDKIKRYNYKNLNFFKDRKKIGKIFSNIDKMIYFLNNKNNKKELKKYSKNISIIYKNFFKKNINIFDFVYKVSKND